MAFVDLQDVRLHYQRDGDPALPPLLLSNSLGSALRMWDAQMARLTEHFCVLRYDTRGHGQSSVPVGPYSLEKLGQDVVGLLAQLGIERTHFVGLSLGGLTGQWLALHHADKLDRLVLANTAAEFGSPDLWTSRIDTALDQGLAGLAEGTMARWFTAGFTASQPDATDRIHQMILATDAQGYAASCAALRGVDLRSELVGIAVPTLVIAGAHDPSTTPAAARLMVEAIPGARYVELDAAHLSNVEQPEAFTNAVVEFLM